jgi:flagellar hook-length control protein FliK
LLFGARAAPPADAHDPAFYATSSLLRPSLGPSQRLVLPALDPAPTLPRPESTPPDSDPLQVWPIKLPDPPSVVTGPRLDAVLAAPESADFEALGRRLAEAIAHRVAAQFRQGQWQIHFAMDPGDLGRIEVALKMQPDGLEAQLNPQSQTARELLAEGLPRLRDVLAQNGMDVASIQLGAYGGSRGGGNPTPRPGKGLKLDVAEPTDASRLTPSVRRSGEEPSGLDLWV